MNGSANREPLPSEEAEGESGVENPGSHSTSLEKSVGDSKSLQTELLLVFLPEVIMLIKT